MEGTPPEVEARAPAPPAGALAQGLRYLVAILVVAVWMAIGFAFHMTGNNSNIYLVLTIPAVVLFQLVIRRQPLREVWVRGSPRFRLDWIVAVVFALLALVPAYETVVSVQTRNWPQFLYSLAAVGGAFGAAYALRNAWRQMAWQLPLGVAVVCVIGVVLYVAEALLFAHGLRHPRPLVAARSAALSFFTYLPAVFVVEEVFFRGTLDSYLHEHERGIGWLSAIVVSALWGLWHVPVTYSGHGSLLRVILELLVFQIALGIPLSIFWRISRNLLVPGAAHALNDALRNMLVGLP